MSSSRTKSSTNDGDTTKDEINSDDDSNIDDEDELNLDSDSDGSDVEALDAEEILQQQIEQWTKDLESFPDVPDFLDHSGLCFRDGVEEPIDFFNRFFNDTLGSF